MWVKLHKSSRTVVAICDENLLGKKFKEGIKKLEVTESFFKGQKLSNEETSNLMKYEFKLGSTFNIVGKESTKLAISTGIITKDEVLKVKNIPFTLIIN